MGIFIINQQKDPHMKRRLLLAAIGSSVMAGCQSLAYNEEGEMKGTASNDKGGSKGATSVVIHNGTNETMSLSFSVADMDDNGTPRVKETVTLDPLEQIDPINEQHLSKLPVGGNYIITIDVEGGPSETFQWQDVRLELAPLHVIVEGNSNILFALAVG